MKKVLIFLSIFLSIFCGKTSVLQADQFDYQNYNHGYYPNCDKCGCNPCSCRASEPSAPDQLPPPTPAPGTNPCPPCQTPPPTPAPCNTPCNTPYNYSSPTTSPCATGPCTQAPCAASVCGANCGISIWALGIGIAAICAAAAIIISSGNGHAAH